MELLRYALYPPGFLLFLGFRSTLQSAVIFGFVYGLSADFILKTKQKFVSSLDY